MNFTVFDQRRVLMRVVITVAIALGISTQTHAEESGGQVENIGFMKSPPAEVKTRFPMCEKFLDVQWLDKKYMVGYATYDAFVRKKPTDAAVRKRVNAIVAIPFGVPRRYDYDAYQFVRQGKLKELFDRIRSEQSLLAGLAFSIGEGDTRIDLHPGGALSYGESHPLLSDHQKTVCIVYPTGDWAWIIEGKTVGGLYTNNQVEEIFGTLKAQSVEFALAVFKSMWVLDVNRDGINDYFMPHALIYSVEDRLRSTVKEYKHPNFIFNFLEKKKKCVVNSNKMNFDLTTDGKSYFAAGCNWTELSSME